MAHSAEEIDISNDDTEVEILAPENLTFLGFSREKLEEAILRVRLARTEHPQAA